jgi:soluble lytic murein transglycosylase-like protein
VLVSLCMQSGQVLAGWPTAHWPQATWGIRSASTASSRPPKPVLSHQRLGLASTRRELPLWLVRKIEAEASQHRINTKLAITVVLQESAGNPLAESPVGAIGLMQLMPDTAKDLGISDRRDPDQSLAGGLRYLRGLLDRFGSTRLALAAYNSGPDRVAKLGRVPAIPETLAYVARICARVQC